MLGAVSGLESLPDKEEDEEEEEEEETAAGKGRLAILIGPQQR